MLIIVFTCHLEFVQIILPVQINLYCFSRSFPSICVCSLLCYKSAAYRRYGLDYILFVWFLIIVMAGANWCRYACAVCTVTLRRTLLYKVLTAACWGFSLLRRHAVQVYRDTMHCSIGSNACVFCTCTVAAILFVNNRSYNRIRGIYLYSTFCKSYACTVVVHSSHLKRRSHSYPDMGVPFFAQTGYNYHRQLLWVTYMYCMCLVRPTYFPFSLVHESTNQPQHAFFSSPRSFFAQWSWID